MRGSAAASPLRCDRFGTRLDRRSSAAAGKMQIINNTSFFKKLLGFSLETYFLSAQGVRLVEEICS